MQNPLNGPKATASIVVEGWTLYATPGPNFQNVTDQGSADSHYYDWVDQTRHPGSRNSSDALLALVNGKWLIPRVPDPLHFFAKAMDGHTGDPQWGWKCKGIWTTRGTRTPFHFNFTTSLTSGDESSNQSLRR